VGVKIKFVLYMTEEGFDEALEKPEVFEKNFKLVTSWKTSNMHCFDAEFTMRKYETIGDILEAFVKQRLPAYEQRRLKQLEHLLKEATELEAKRAFIQAVLDGRIVMMRKTKEEIVKMLQTCGIPPLSNQEKPEEYESYRYVVKLPMDKVTKEEIDILERDVANKRAEMRVLEVATPALMWLKDLEEFVGAWEAMRAEREALLSGVAAPKKFKVKRKGAAAA
jgi:DNA topoisomerase-2